MPPLSPSQARDLVDHFGGQQKAAAAIGVPRTTLRSWLGGDAERARQRERYAADPEPKRTRTREHDRNLTGVAYGRRLLNKRRINALRRRADRQKRSAA